MTEWNKELCDERHDRINGEHDECMKTVERLMEEDKALHKRITDFQAKILYTLFGIAAMAFVNLLVLLLRKA